MRLAIDEARQGDFPFGAVITQDGSIVARGRNLGRTNADPTAHGEMIAIRRCLADRGPAALRGSTLYTSGEPCAMCMGAILWSGVGRLVFAASVAQLATKIDQIMLTGAEVAANGGPLSKSQSPEVSWRTKPWRCSRNRNVAVRGMNFGTQMSALSYWTSS